MTLKVTRLQMRRCKVQGESCIHKWEEGALPLPLLPRSELLLTVSSCWQPPASDRLGFSLALREMDERTTGLILIWDSLFHTEKTGYFLPLRSICKLMGVKVESLWLLPFLVLEGRIMPCVLIVNATGSGPSKSVSDWE